MTERTALRDRTGLLGVAARWRDARRRRRAIATLLELSPAELADLGVVRGEVEAALAGRGDAPRRLAEAMAERARTERAPARVPGAKPLLALLVTPEGRTRTMARPLPGAWSEGRGARRAA
ncbi:DUF1127 domain-containing protein [Acuticoccus mangrovi]|uniref:DUF1127 domain-containing protein n=1 Tax=Acuticoccus mangrovi TaxID=2796142 RepID=A0A934IRF8_9HYPH|nr:DUF1127 domain-containing protein [Acuticoccus mangrovi]MBJ3776289.1 DUF1127 domain-containing protein [Acuticoccus mangrovi]